MTLYDSGIRPLIDEWLLKEAEKKRDYGEMWSASSAGYCHRKLIFERLGVPPVAKESDARRQRVFTSGHLFHSWIQGITREMGVSVAQELELEDTDLMVRGHIDDLVLINGRLILYDAKTQHANAFTWQKGRPASHFHRMQVGTYMYMLRKKMLPFKIEENIGETDERTHYITSENLSEARILKISKDDLRMDENQILWRDELQAEVLLYWGTLNSWWNDRKIPPCTCADKEGGFMAREKFNPYFYEGEPCSLKLYQKFKEANAN